MLPIDVELLMKAVGGEYTAIRRITRLEAQGEKVFPPTYEGDEYAIESRQVREEGGHTRIVETVLLDSVQSQANRMELALLRAAQAGRLKIPIVQVDFGSIESGKVLEEIGCISALEAPHRICDAIFRDSLRNGRPFRESDIGSRLDSVSAVNATVLFEVCPTALLFGFWDSAGPRGGFGARVPRSLVSEIVGYDVVLGKRPVSRIDPLQIENNTDIFEAAEGGWTLSEHDALKKNGKAVRKRPSEINHGNIIPSLRRGLDRTGKQILNHGGVTMSYATQQTVFSLAALRRLRFPVSGNLSAEADHLARTVLAALGITAICLANEEGYDLRSRCLLDGTPGPFEFVGRGETRLFEADANGAIELLQRSTNRANALGLCWREEPITLQASEDLKRLVSESRKRSLSSLAGR